MTLTVREMADSEADVVIEYFLKSTPEHLENLGVDPTRLPAPEGWRERLRGGGGNVHKDALSSRAAVVYH